jgi:iron complex transport system ATP-binding protein
MLEIRSLSVAYGREMVLREVSLSVPPGTVTALIGPNGAGKSTLIRAISGVVPKASGEVRLNGIDLTAQTPSQRARLLAVVPQSRQLGGAFTVEQAVMMGRTAYMNWLGQPGEEDQAKVHLAMENTNTVYLAHRRIATLSGGEQQRVLLARALAQDTPVLLLDEPTTHLDIQHKISLLSLVGRLAHQNGLTVLVALHDLNQVSLYADRVALLVEGRLQTVGKPEEVLTAERLSDAYQTSVQVISPPEHDVLIVLPD